MKSIGQPSTDDFHNKISHPYTKWILTVNHRVSLSLKLCILTAVAICILSRTESPQDFHVDARAVINSKSLISLATVFTSRSVLMSCLHMYYRTLTIIWTTLLTKLYIVLMLFFEFWTLYTKTSFKIWL